MYLGFLASKETILKKGLFTDQATEQHQYLSTEQSSLVESLYS